MVPNPVPYITARSPIWLQEHSSSKGCLGRSGRIHNNQPQQASQGASQVTLLASSTRRLEPTEAMDDIFRKLHSGGLSATTCNTHLEDDDKASRLRDLGPCKLHFKMAQVGERIGRRARKSSNQDPCVS